MPNPGAEERCLGPVCLGRLSGYLFASVLPSAASLFIILERETYSLLTINVVAFVYDGDNWHWCASYSKLVWTVARDCEALHCYLGKKNRSSTAGTMHFTATQTRWHQSSTVLRKKTPRNLGNPVKLNNDLPGDSFSPGLSEIKADSTFGRLSDAEDDSEVEDFFLCESDSYPSNGYWSDDFCFFSGSRRDVKTHENFRIKIQRRVVRSWCKKKGWSISYWFSSGYSYLKNNIDRRYTNK